MTINSAAGARLDPKNDLSQLGARLIRFGQALQNPETTVGQLSSLANACGIALKLRAVAESEVSQHD